MGRITFTQAMMADLEIRQGTRRGEVASRLLPDLSPARAMQVLRQELKQHDLYRHNPAPNARNLKPDPR